MFFQKKVNQLTIPRFGIIIKCNNEYLVVHQRCSGYIGFSKGVMNYKEDILIGSLRELYEETNIKLDSSVLENCPIIRVFFKSFRHHYFLVEIPEKVDAFPNDTQEILGCYWMNIEQLKKETTSICSKLVINQLTEIEKKTTLHFNTLILNLY